MKLVIFLLLLSPLLVSCRVARTVNRTETEVVHVLKRDTAAVVRFDSLRDLSYTKETRERTDTIIKPDTVHIKTEISIDHLKEKATRGEKDTMLLYDEVGNQLGYMINSLDTLSNKINRITHVTPPVIHIHTERTILEHHADKTAVSKAQATAARIEDSSKSIQVEKVTEAKKESKGINFNLMWLGAVAILVIGLLIYFKKK